MMKTSTRSPLRTGFIAALLAASASGCAPLMNQGYPVGGIYHSAKIPSVLDRVETSGPGKTGAKSGSACTSGVLGVYAGGDASIDAAKKAGGITNVHSVEVQTKAILGFVYVEACTVVHGD